MKIVRCTKVKNHFYDSDKYESCPHCGGSAAPAKSSKKSFFGKSEKTQPPAAKPVNAPAPNYVQQQNDATQFMPIEDRPYSMPPQQNAPAPSQQGGAYAATVFMPIEERPYTVQPSNPAPASDMNDVTQFMPMDAEPDPSDVTQFMPMNDDFYDPSEVTQFMPMGDDMFDSSEVTQFMPMDNDMSAQSSLQFSSVEEAKYLSADEEKLRTAGLRDVHIENVTIEPVTGWLSVISPSSADRGRSFTLKSGGNTIGKGKSADVLLAHDPTLSGEADAMIIYDPEDRLFFIQPIQNTAHIRLNGRLINMTSELAPYDRVVVGNTEMVFVPLCCEKFSWEN